MRRKFLCFNVLLVFVCCSCANVSEQSSESMDAGKENLIDLLVTTHVASSEYADMSFVKTNESEDVINIEPSSDYYNRYRSSERMELQSEPNDGWFCDDLEYPHIEYIITNNTEEPISINSIKTIVEKSSDDQFPYLFIYQDGEYSNCLFFWNESWTDWGTMTFDYSILEKDESFNGQYDKTLSIPFFTDYMVVDFYNDLIEKGYDPEPLNEVYFELDDNQYHWFKNTFKICGKGCDYSHLFMPSLYIAEEEIDATSYSDLFYPFEYGNLMSMCGYARFYGKISFSNSDFTKEIKGLIYLTPPGNGGADLELSEEFDIILKNNAEDYEISKPYVTVIAPHEAERISLTYKCSRSARHDFYVSIENENGLNIRSKNISLYLLNGRHSTKQPEIINMYEPHE